MSFVVDEDGEAPATVAPPAAVPPTFTDDASADRLAMIVLGGVLLAIAALMVMAAPGPKW